MYSTTALENMDQDQEAEAKRRKAKARARVSDKQDKGRAHRGKEIDSERLSKAIMSTTTVSDGEIRDCSCFLCHGN
jgi:hypothetical protein